MKQQIIKNIQESIAVKEKVIESCINSIEKAASAMVSCLKNNGKIILFGNGGSAADSQHIAAELIGRFKKERKPYPAIALTTDTSIITALSNDYNFESIFSRQIEALGNKGDVAIGISTSGNSLNVINGLLAAKKFNLKTIAFTGQDGGKMKKLTDILIAIPSNNTPRIQEAHITIAHIICELVETKLN